MRGKVSVHPCLPCSFGITPARAGKSIFRFGGLNLVGDHPRACGEKLYDASFCIRNLGSPPRVRGKVGIVQSLEDALGITPARAGKSCCSSSRFCICWDHPRACGEKFLPPASPSNYWGSPPRVRGKVRRRGCKSFRCGITPARAGKSGFTEGRTTRIPDHPRACGEKTETHPLFAAFLRKTPIYTAILCR